MDESADSTFTRIEFTRIRRAKRGFDDEICDVNSDQDDVFDVPTKKIRLNKDRSRIKVFDVQPSLNVLLAFLLIKTKR